MFGQRTGLSEHSESTVTDHTPDPSVRNGPQNFVTLDQITRRQLCWRPLTVQLVLDEIPSRVHVLVAACGYAAVNWHGDAGDPGRVI